MVRRIARVALTFFACLRRRAAPSLIAAAMGMAVLGSTTASASETVTRSFGYTGGEQTFVAPSGVSSVQIVAIGGAGGGGSQPAQVTGRLGVTPGTTYYVEVAGTGAAGGFNGGGQGWGNGGGATDLRTTPHGAGLSREPDPRLLVAAGGGGESQESAGGAAGRPGSPYPSSLGGAPGNESSGGKGGEVEECFWEEHPLIPVGQPGSDGETGEGGGGASCSTTRGGAFGGGGGGGLYGGDGGSAWWVDERSEDGGGGGGSSLVPLGGTFVLAPSTAQPRLEISYVQPPNPPAVLTTGASQVRSEAATANATVNPENTAVQTCRFEYGPSVSYGESAPCASTPGAGVSPVAVQATIPTLAPSTTYHYRIVASNANGTSYGSDQAFTTHAHEVPTVSQISPASGPQPGGTQVTITGADFYAVSSVRFGSVAASSYTVTSPTSITAVSPPGAAGVVDVVVTTPEGTSAPSAADRFAYPAVAPITKLAPKKSLVAGGITVTITGSNLTNTTAVRFGAVDATSFKVVSDTKLTAVAPPQPVGRVDVRLTTPAGTTPVVTADRFTYVPTVTGLSPASGPKMGGTTVTVTGSGFATGRQTTFRFGATPPGSGNCSTTTTCTVVTPAHAIGTVDVKASVNKIPSGKTTGDRYTFN